MLPQHVVDYYSCNRVDRTEVRRAYDEEGGTRFVVELGDALGTLPKDKDVAALCLRMYSSIRTISTKYIYLYASGDDFETDALGNEFDNDPMEWILFDYVVENPDWRFPATRMSHVAVSVIQEFCMVPEAESFGSTRSSVSFESQERALLALAVEKVHNPGTTRDVLAVLSRSLDVSCLRTVFGRRITVTIDSSSNVDDDMVTIGTTTWVTHVRRTRSYGFAGKMAHLWVLRNDGRMSNCAMKIVFVEHHWTESFDKSNRSCLSHRTVPDCSLVFHPYAVGGGVILLEFVERDDFPWWITDEMRRIPSAIFLGISHTSIRLRDAALEKRCVDKRFRSVVGKWEKSSSARGVHAPSLVRTIPLDLDDDRTVQTLTLTASRCQTLEEMEEKDSVRCLYQAEFGNQYGREAVEHAASVDDLACYLVKDSTQQFVVGAFSVVLFDCILDNGDMSIALMIDTFAVKKKFHGKGYGRQMYHNMVLNLVQRRLAPGTHYVVFAQCVLSRPGCDFWYDKLDESGVARSLLLQTFSMCDWVEPQANSCCAPRSRMYRC